MPTDPVRSCTDAKKELDRIEGELREIAEIYFTIGSAFEHSPPRLVIANSDLAAPREIGPRWIVPAVDYLAWPDKETVKEKLRAYYNAEDAYRQAWRALRPEERVDFPRPNR